MDDRAKFFVLQDHSGWNGLVKKMFTTDCINVPKKQRLDIFKRYMNEVTRLRVSDNHTRYTINFHKTSLVVDLLVDDGNRS